MFVDSAKISITAGKGGDGCVHFRREKFIPKGGPDGGNGGKGGDIIFRSVDNLHTLYDFRHQKVFKAENGRPGEKKNKTGKNGENLIIEVPVGTMVKQKNKLGEISDNSSGSWNVLVQEHTADSINEEILFDFTQKGQTTVLAHGGIGGKGNAGFVSSIRQAPSFAEKGDLGDFLELELELKLVADVALVGYPSVGKSTLISVVSNAKPKIAAYHFTTLVPNLGVCKIEDREIIFVDVPGLIEGASEGKGLGHTFLKHIERAGFVLQLIDITAENPLEDFRIIRKELEKFSSALAQKPFLPVFAKIDLSDKEFEDFICHEFEQEFGIKPFKISAATHEGVNELLKFLLEKVPEKQNSETTGENITEEESTEPTDENFVEFRPGQRDDEKTVYIEKTENWWNLEGKRILQIGRQTEWMNEQGIERVYDVLRKWGVISRLEKSGAHLGDKIRIGENFLEYRG